MTWSPAAGLNVVSVEPGEQAWTVTVDSQQSTFCPGCGTQSESRHSTYLRTLRDLSAQGAPVVVNARLGRWRCRNQQCDRFKDHPNVDVVSRDRAGLYAEAAREGAPQARQVADRFHLMQNFRETVERQLGGYEAPIRDSRISGNGIQVLSALPARLDRRSEAAAQTHLIRRERQAGRQQIFDEIRALFEGGNSIGELPASLALAAGASKDGCVASTCRTVTQWRQPLPLRRISAFYSSGGGPRALPKSATCSRRYAVAAIPGASVIWRVSFHPGAAVRLPSMTTSRKH
jgi:hypothetical protein